MNSMTPNIIIKVLIFVTSCFSSTSFYRDNDVDDDVKTLLKIIISLRFLIELKIEILSSFSHWLTLAWVICVHVSAKVFCSFCTLNVGILCIQRWMLNDMTHVHGQWYLKSTTCLYLLMSSRDWIVWNQNWRKKKLS